MTKYTTAYGKDCTPDENFNWSLYENGYTGGSSMVPNRKVKTNGKDVCYCHEPYAQSLYDMYDAYFAGRGFIAPKDLSESKVFVISDITKVSSHEVLVDSDNGMSAVVDMNKEGMFLNSIGVESVEAFVSIIENNPQYKKALLEMNVCAKVVDNGRISLWDGYCAKIESELFEELQRKDGPKYGYNAKILSLGNGGYMVEVMGLNCFLPTSLASSGPIQNPESLIGTELKVCVVNYSKITKNFVVSHKKYLEITLPSRIAEELYIGKHVFVKVTGISKNGLFCAIRDKNDNYTFASLMHRTTMSPDTESSFDKREFLIGDCMMAYVHKINWINDKECRIVIGDAKPVVEKKEIGNDTKSE